MSPQARVCVVALLVAMTSVGVTLAPADAGEVGTSARTSTGGSVADPTADAGRMGSRAGGPAPTMRAVAGDTPTQKTQQVTVDWKGTDANRDYTKSAVIPGIGLVSLVCRPDSTMVRLYAEDRNAETQMWMSKYETKDNHAVVAVKTARIYRYSDAGDDGTGGTGSYAHEGLNQEGSIENYSSGYMNGIISQRPGRNQPVTGSNVRPVTSFKLNWYWTGFRNPMDYRSCKIDAVFKTRLDTRLGVNWHGEADAVDNVLQVTKLPSIGDLLLKCESNADGNGALESIALAPSSQNARVFVEYVTGEGLVENHVESFTVTEDPETGRLGPFPLPRNGMMRLYFTVDGVERAYIVSSYFVNNNKNHPALNVCETAAAAY